MTRLCWAPTSSVTLLATVAFVSAVWSLGSGDYVRDARSRAKQNHDLGHCLILADVADATLVSVGAIDRPIARMKGHEEACDPRYRNASAHWCGDRVGRSACRPRRALRAVGRPLMPTERCALAKAAAR
jgi:hypothetical protein